MSGRSDGHFFLAGASKAIIQTRLVTSLLRWHALMESKMLHSKLSFLSQIVLPKTKTRKTQSTVVQLIFIIGVCILA